MKCRDYTSCSFIRFKSCWIRSGITSVKKLNSITALMSITTYQNMFTKVLCQLFQKGDFMLISSRMFTHTNDYNLLTTGASRKKASSFIIIKHLSFRQTLAFSFEALHKCFMMFFDFFADSLCKLLTIYCILYGYIRYKVDDIAFSCLFDFLKSF
jgi:hypothetical protein